MNEVVPGLLTPKGADGEASGPDYRSDASDGGGKNR